MSVEVWRAIWSEAKREKAMEEEITKMELGDMHACVGARGRWGRTKEGHGSVKEE